MGRIRKDMDHMVMDDGEMYNLSGLAQGDFDILVNNESQSALCELKSFSQDHRASANAIRVFCPPATPPPHPRFPSPNHDVAHRREGGCGKDSIQRQGRGREYKRTPEEPSTIGISETENGDGGTGEGRVGGWQNTWMVRVPFTHGSLIPITFG